MGSLFLTCLQHLAYRDPMSQVLLSSSVPQSCAYVGLQPVLWQKGITRRGAHSQEGPVLVVMLSCHHLEIVKNCNSELIFGEGSPMGHGMVLVKGDMNYSCSCHPFLPTIVYSPQTPPEHTLWNFSWTHRSQWVRCLQVRVSKVLTAPRGHAFCVNQNFLLMQRECTCILRHMKNQETYLFLLSAISQPFRLNMMTQKKWKNRAPIVPFASALPYHQQIEGREYRMSQCQEIK